MIIIGIDIGGSTTKIISLDNKRLLSPMQVKAHDPITSVYGAFGKYISENNMSISDIDKIMVTGVGSTFIKENIYDIPTFHVPEFNALGLGGLYLSGLENAIIVSMGTGTAFVKAEGSRMTHIGGTGVGGGTLLGLSSKLLNLQEFDSLVTLSADGVLDNVDLTVGDISKTGVSTMPKKTTASNFGKISDYATKNDIAKGLINMVFQTIGMMAVFACRIDNTKEVVLCGNLTTIPQAKEIFDGIKDLHDINFYLPAQAEYATAIGAALY